MNSAIRSLAGKVWFIYGLQCLIFALLLVHSGLFWIEVNTRQDNPSYLAVARALTTHDFASVEGIQNLWGIPYVIVGGSSVLGISHIAVLISVSMVAGLLAILQIEKLWGTIAALWFMGLNWEWVRRSVEGGSEPLFLALVTAAFLLARKQRWYLAAFLAAVSTTVRPVGIFVLLGIGFALAKQKRWRDLIVATSLAMAIGIAYVTPFQLIYHRPFLNFANYRSFMQTEHWLSLPLLPFSRDCMRLPYWSPRLADHLAGRISMRDRCHGTLQAF